MNKYQESFDGIIACSGFHDCECVDLNILKELVDRATPVAIEMRRDGFYCLFTSYGVFGDGFWLCNEKDINLKVWKVIAWMPLPKPYRKEDEE